jgi:hypothetical protein
VGLTASVSAALFNVETGAESPAEHPAIPNRQSTLARVATRPTILATFTADIPGLNQV